VYISENGVLFDVGTLIMESLYIQAGGRAFRHRVWAFLTGLDCFARRHVFRCNGRKRIGRIGYPIIPFFCFSSTTQYSLVAAPVQIGPSPIKDTTRRVHVNLEAMLHSPATLSMQSTCTRTRWYALAITAHKSRPFAQRPGLRRLVFAS
jgi:hypothetical protein